jgi:ketosteroid isomerase-like protein
MWAVSSDRQGGVMPTAVEDIVRQFIDGLNKRDVEGMIATFAPDAEVHFPGLETTDVAGFRQFLEQAAAAIRDHRLEEKEIFVTDYGAAVRWTYDATTIAGRTAHCEGVDSWVVKDGKATWFGLYGDLSPLLAALQG